jgi:hypothetical protein
MHKPTPAPSNAALAASALNLSGRVRNLATGYTLAGL